MRGFLCSEGYALCSSRANLPQLVGQCGRRQVTHLWARDGFEPLRSNMLQGQFSWLAEQRGELPRRLPAGDAGE